MNVGDVRDLFEYHTWATTRLFDALAPLPAEQYKRDLKGSFGSIHGTVAHMVGAEQLWLARWKGQAPATMLKGDDVGSLTELRAIWERVEAEVREYVAGLTDASLNSKVVVKPTGGGTEYVHTLQQTIQHTVDHASYHRGQVITLLRQLGSKPPATGLIAFYREQTARPAAS